MYSFHLLDVVFCHNLSASLSFLCQQRQSRTVQHPQLLCFLKFKFQSSLASDNGTTVAKKPESSTIHPLEAWRLHATLDVVIFLYLLFTVGKDILLRRQSDPSLNYSHVYKHTQLEDHRANLINRYM